MEENTTTDITRFVLQHDRDRALAALSADEPVREDLLAVLAWNYELARVSEQVTTEPMVGLIRQTWWREVLEEIKDDKPPRPHAVVQAMAEVLGKHDLPIEDFATIVAARGADLEKAPFETPDQLEAYCEQTAGTLQKLCAMICKDTKTQEAIHIGTAWGLIGIIRAVHFLAHQNKLRLPTVLLEKAGISQDDVLLGRPSRELNSVCQKIAERAEARLEQAGNTKGTASHALAILAKDYLKRIKKRDCNPFDPRIENGRAWRATKLMLFV